MKAIDFINKTYQMIPTEKGVYPPKPKDAKTVRQLLDMDRKPVSEEAVEYFEMPFLKHGIRNAYAYVRMENTELLTLEDKIEIESYRQSCMVASQVKREERAKEREEAKEREREEKKTAVFKQIASLHDKNILVFDVETTGFSPSYDELLQISIVDGKTGRPLLDTYVKPVNKKYWPQAEAVNHITPQMVKHAPTADMIADTVRNYFDKADAVVGHNVAFDARFVSRIFRYVIPEEKLFDTMKIYRADAPKEESYSLDSAVRFYCPEAYAEYASGAHNSLADTMATAKVFMKQIEKGRSMYDLSENRGQEYGRREKEERSAVKSPIIGAENIILCSAKEYFGRDDYDDYDR